MILTIGPGGCGFTFLNWTISYLRGDIFYTRLDGRRQLMDIDPLKGITAHNFDKDHLTPNQSKDILKNGSNLSIVYVVPKSQQDFVEILNLPGKKIIFDNTKNARELLARSCLTISTTKENTSACLDRLIAKYGEFNSRQVFLECADFFVRYYQVPTQSTSVYYSINYLDIFQNLDSKLSDLFLFLQITIDPIRFDRWKQIYQTYKSKNSNFIEKFLGNKVVDVDASTRKDIFKDIMCWRNGLYRLTKTS